MNSGCHHLSSQTTSHVASLYGSRQSVLFTLYSGAYSKHTDLAERKLIIDDAQEVGGKSQVPLGGDQLGGNRSLASLHVRAAIVKKGKEREQFSAQKQNPCRRKVVLQRE